MNPQLNKACLATRFYFLIAGLAISSWAPIVPFAKSNLGLNEEAIGLVMLFFGIGALTMMPMANRLVQRFGIRPMALIAGLILAAILPLIVLAPSPLHLSMYLFLFGNVMGILNVSINSHAIQVESQAAIPLMSGFHGLFSFGGLLGAATISMLLELGLPLLICALFISVSIALIVITQFKHLLDTHEEAKPVQKIKFTFPRPLVIFLGTLCFISFLAEGCILDWSAVYLRSCDYDLSIAGLGYAFFSVAMAFGRWQGDGLIGRYGESFILKTGGFLAASGLFIATTIHWAHSELFGFFLVGLGASNIVPVLFGSAGKIPKTSSHVALTIMITLGYTGLLIGPAVIGFIAQHTSLSFALICVAFLLLIVGTSHKAVQFDSINKETKSANC